MLGRRVLDGEVIGMPLVAEVIEFSDETFLKRRVRNEGGGIERDEDLQGVLEVISVDAPQVAVAHGSVRSSRRYVPAILGASLAQEPAPHPCINVHGE